jgi:hypothetical protein
MKPTTIKILGVTILALAAVTLVFWSQISEAFGPMKQNQLQCLICHRERVEKWVCGSKVRDDIVTNEHSEWIDSFTPSDHQHVWIGHTSYNRHYWFGRTSIGCGGVATIPRIFEQRNSLGESEARQLAAKFHQLVNGQSPSIDFSELDRFTKAVAKDPAALLKTENPK